MAVDAGQLLGGALGGALASSIPGPWIAQRRERLDVRADVLRSIGELEGARWAPTTYANSRACVVKLRASALVARAHRDTLDTYIYFAQAAYNESAESWETYHGDEEDGAGAIPETLGNLVQDSARLLTEGVWHPYRSRLRVRHGLASVKSKADELRADEDERISWPRRLL